MHIAFTMDCRMPWLQQERVRIIAQESDSGHGVPMAEGVISKSSIPPVLAGAGMAYTTSGFVPVRYGLKEGKPCKQ